MALLDLALVTRTLIEVVKRAINASPAAPPQPVKVTSLPPDRLTEDNSIGIYLYHLVEEAAHKSQPWPGRPDRPIRFSPMGLSLHYVVSAHSESTDNEGPYREQLLMGLAAKALHDYPIIDDDTTVGGFQVVPTGLLGDENKLRIALRHVPVNEAVSYWTAGSHPLRLSSYYEASVVLLEPEEPARATGRVLSWGVDVFVGGLPRLIASRSTVTFSWPGDPSARTVTVQPAQPAIGGAFTLEGRGLGGGSIELLIRGPGWPEARPAGESWGASVFGDEVTAVVQDDVDGEPSLPGTYAASVRVRRTTTLADGTTHTDVVASNETPFQIAPAVTGVGVPSASGVFTVTGKIFQHTPLLPASLVRASIGRAQLAPGTYGALAPGQLAVHSPTEIQMRLPADAQRGDVLPVRVVIGGSESPPAWVVAP